jgi:hypothetical protein
VIEKENNNNTNKNDNNSNNKRRRQAMQQGQEEEREQDYAVPLDDYDEEEDDDLRWEVEVAMKSHIASNTRKQYQNMQARFVIFLFQKHRDLLHEDLRNSFLRSPKKESVMKKIAREVIVRASPNYHPVAFDQLAASHVMEFFFFITPTTTDGSRRYRKTFNDCRSSVHNLFSECQYQPSASFLSSLTKGMKGLG